MPLHGRFVYLIAIPSSAHILNPAYLLQVTLGDREPEANPAPPWKREAEAAPAPPWRRSPPGILTRWKGADEAKREAVAAPPWRREPEAEAAPPWRREGGLAGSWAREPEPEAAPPWKRESVAA